MAKNKKNKSKIYKKDNDKVLPSSKPAKILQETPPNAGQPEIPEVKPLQLKSLIGTMNVDLYNRLFKPSFVAFEQQHNDEPLRQLIESIVTSIALTEDPVKYQKINDISQRYLYYLESSNNSNSYSWDAVVASNLCDYWRTQVFMMLIRNASEICTLLLPEPQDDISRHHTFPQNDFLNSILLILNDSLCPDSEGHIAIPELYHFSKGISFPWLDFDTRMIFNIQSIIHDDDLQTKHEFAIMDNETLNHIYPLIIKSINNVLFFDLVFTQYKKIYDELSNAFSSDEALPQNLLELLGQKIRFDTNYQAGFDAISQGHTFSGKLHRASRIDLNLLNTFGQINDVLKYAFEHGLGVYLFHYLG